MVDKSDDKRVKGAVGGVIYFMFAKIYFMAAGYAVVFGLPYAFRWQALQGGLDQAAAGMQSVKHYGHFLLVNEAVGLLNMVLIDGTRYTVSKFISADESNAGMVRRVSLLLQACIGGALTLAYFLSAPLVADIFHRPELVDAYRISALIPLSYTFYAVFRGYLNGMRSFFREAVLDVSFSTVKPVAMLAAVFLGFGVLGAMGGFALAALVITLVALAMTLGGPRREPVAARDLWSFQWKIMMFTALFYALIKVDLFLIGILLTGEAGDLATGRYGSMLQIARIVWQGTFAITVVIFPLVSKVVAEGEPETAKRYISQALRFTFLIAGFLAVAFSANAPEVLSIVFPSKAFAVDPAPLRIMAFAKLAFALFMVTTTVISGSGRPLASVALVACTLAVSITLNSLAIPRWGLMGAAVATASASAVGLGMALTYLRKTLGAGVPGGTALRGGAVMLACWLLSYNLDLGGKMADLGELVGLGLLYVVLVLLVREITPTEIKSLRSRS